MSTPYRDAVASDSPVLYLSRAVDGTAWRNEVDSDHNATLANGAAMEATGYTTDDDAARLSLDGDDDHAVVADHAAISPVEAITVEAIIEPTGDESSPREVIVAKGNQAHYTLELSGGDNTNRLQFVLYRSSDGSVFYNNVNATNFPVDRGRKNHVVARWSKSENGGAIDFWINGVQTDGVRSSDTHTGDLDTTSEDLWVGAMEGIDRYFGGYLAEVAIYDTYLSDARIEAHHEAALKLGELIDTQFGDGIGEERYSVNTNSRGVYHDGTRFWLGYSNDSRPKLLSGASLDDLTDHGDQLGEDVIWDGLTHTWVFGKISGVHYAWLICCVDSDQGFTVRRFSLATGSPVQDESLFVDGPSGNGHMHAWPERDASGNVTAIYAMRHRRDSDLPGDDISEMHMRVFEPDLSDSTDGGSWAVSIGPSIGLYAPLSDGVIAALNDIGPESEATIDKGILEITMPSIGGAQTEHFVTGSDNQSYGDVSLPQAHSSVCSMIRQAGSDELWVVYQGDEDAEDNAYGLVNLWHRTGSVSGSWSRISDDLFDGVYVWHIAMTQSDDGKTLHFAYVEAEGDDNLRGRTVWHRSYNVVSGEVSSATKLADIPPGLIVDTVMLGRQTYGPSLAAVYTAHDGTINSGVNSGGNTSIYATSVVVGALRRRFARHRSAYGVRRMGPETMGRR